MANLMEMLIREELLHQGVQIKEMAARLQTPQSNLSKKLTKNDFKESDMHKMAEALGKKLVIQLVDKEED